MRGILRKSRQDVGTWVLYSLSVTKKSLEDAAAANPNDNAAAVQEYNDWSQAHYRRVGDTL
jgi:hypothetical protein